MECWGGRFVDGHLGISLSGSTSSRVRADGLVSFVSSLGLDLFGRDTIAQLAGVFSPPFSVRVGDIIGIRVRARCRIRRISFLFPSKLKKAFDKLPI
jgi:hypothetical protein